MTNKFDANKVNLVEVENYLNESLKIAKFQTSIINEIKDKMYVIIIKKYITKHYTLNLKKIMSPSLTI